MKQLLVFLLLINTIGYAQSTAELDKKSGFQDIKLGTLATDYPFLVFKGEKTIDGKFENEYGPATYGPNLKKYKIGNDYCDVFVGADKNHIIKTIAVYPKIEKNSGLKLVEALTKLYGPPTETIMNLYIWKGNNVKLSLKNGHPEGTAVFFVYWLLNSDTDITKDF